ncbi:MAG TPA: TetR/AcrR family transcriptional regulator [Nocardioidaceae bacterium]|nr:TetR/AcrR family transcriptional regulator [Nocardioidaceae bacterium]
MLGAPNRNRQAERRAATRREIVDAAWALAREKGLTEITLREVAARVGMQAPSLYSHFASKNAIYDAMFGEAWSEYDSIDAETADDLPTSPRAHTVAKCLQFFDYATADLPRYQLMNQRTIPGFEPSAESFAPSPRAVQRNVERLGQIGVTDRGDIEILFSIMAGLSAQQLANDPGGDSRRPLLARAVEMWADGVGLPQDPKPRKARK